MAVKSGSCGKRREQPRAIQRPQQPSTKPLFQRRRRVWQGIPGISDTIVPSGNCSYNEGVC